MKICSEISIDIEVGNYLEAADHQKHLEEILRLVRKEYPAASLKMRERRTPRARLTATAPSAGAGALHRYED